jgi:serine/threonine-protein kinase
MVVREQDTRRLLLRELDRLESRMLPGTDGASSPFFSPDGGWLAFFAEGALKKVSLAGGPPLTLAQGTDNRGATWSDDGTIFFAPGTDGGLQRISDQGGELAPATELDAQRGERTHRWPDALPGGKAVLFTSDTFETTEFFDDARIEALVVATGERRVVLEQSSRAQYLEPGLLVFARGGTLFAVAFDPATLAVRGAPVPIVQQVATDVRTGAAQFALSRAGSLLYVPGDASIGLSRPQWADREGSSGPAELEDGRYSQVRLAPDERRLAYSLGSSQTIDLWVADLERGTTSRLTFEGFAQDPVWTPDGQRLAYDLSVTGTDGRAANYLAWKPADGSAEAEVLWEGEGTAAFADCFSPDGELLVFSRSSSGTQSDIWVLPVAGDRTPRPLVQTRFDEYMPEISPDGRWLAYTSNESGRYEVFVRPFPGPGGKWQVSNGEGTEPHWRGDGQELFYRSGGALMRVAVDTAQGFVAGRPERLFEGMRTGGAPMSYAVSRDGRRFLYLPDGTAARLSRAALVLDWASEVERLTAPRK